ncbi:hypothetical protein ACFJIY_06650 [Pimelobacter simplex]|uniref:SCO6745 family protein n=1 Tax=Nocardioides simplex TaxID=2045 RepID=UPI00367112D0
MTSSPVRPSARALWRLLEPVHAVTYFSPEPLGALKEAGYRGFWMGYFAGRAAPLGPASAELVQALFYNFDAEHVARALPDAWTFAPPQAALDARLRGSVATLRRVLGAGEGGAAEGVARAAELAARAALAAPLPGRPLHAANRALPVPPASEPLALLWHAATLLREHRGDGHVATLLAHGIGGRTAHVFRGLVSDTPPEVYRAARHLDDAEWADQLAVLRGRGLADAAGRLTDAGRELDRVVEATTDELAESAYDVLDDAELAQLAADLRPVAAAVVAAGEIPVKSPMGLDLTA